MCPAHVGGRIQQQFYEVLGAKIAWEQEADQVHHRLTATREIKGGVSGATPNRREPPHLVLHLASSALRQAAAPGPPPSPRSGLGGGDALVMLLLARAHGLAQLGPLQREAQAFLRLQIQGHLIFEPLLAGKIGLAQGAVLLNLPEAFEG